jgi:DNA segregation ATPase FtsK/SpoIIIE, S-DNA-T family
VVPIQSALSTCVTDIESDSAVVVAPFVFGERPPERDPATRDLLEPEGEKPTDLARLVDAIVEANAAEGIPAPRRPWPEPLPAHIDLAELIAAPAQDDSCALVALADEPARQRQYPAGWELDRGNLLLFGIAGSGTTTALTSLALSLSSLRAPEQLALYAVDYGAGDLKALEALPHTGSVILAADRERQARLIRWLRAELDRRRADQATGERVPVVVLIDNLAAMRAEFDDTVGQELMDELTRVYADGPQAGILLAVTADRPNAVPSSWMAVTTQKWLFRLPDAYDYVALGLNARDVPSPTPGRAVMAADGVHIQLGEARPSLGEAAAAVAGRFADATPAAAPIRVLPAELTLASLDGRSTVREEPWRIAIGLRESDLATAELVLYEGEHAIVAGPARSGKSLALWTIAESLAGEDVHVAAVAGRRSPLGDCPALDGFAAAGGDATALLAQLRPQSGPVVVLLDDAEGFDDADGAIAGLLAARPDLHLIAAARADSLRSLYGHWTQEVRRSKVGLLLRPDVDFDGDLVGVTLPRRAPVQMTAGRGYLAHNGALDIAQLALPSAPVK